MMFQLIHLPRARGKDNYLRKSSTMSCFTASLALLSRPAPRNVTPGLALVMMPSAKTVSRSKSKFNSTTQPSRQIRITRNAHCKSCTSDALQVVTSRIQFAWSTGEVIRKQNYPVGAHLTRRIYFFHRRFNWNSVSSNPCTDTTSGRVSACRSNFDLLLKGSGVRRIGHRAGDIKNSQGEPATPVLKSTRVGVFIVGKNRRRNYYTWFLFLDASIDSLDEHCDLFALKVAKLIRVCVRRSQWVPF